MMTVSFGCGVWCSIDWSTAVAFLNKWQTLEAAVIAFLPATFAAYWLIQQIRQSDQQEKERQRRRLRAARATLSHTLSAICDYAENVAKTLKTFYPREWVGENNSLGEGLRHAHESFRYTTPEQPPEVLAALERLIEAADDPEISDKVADLLSNMQVLAARLRGLNGKLRSETSKLEVAGYIVDAALLHALASNMFNYGRRKSDQIREVGTEEISVALSTFSIYGDAYSEVFDRIELQFPPIRVQSGSADQ